jgi:DNA-binding HxlR family transcriptional regulator
MGKAGTGRGGGGRGLAGLCRHRWAVPVLAELRRRKGAKFVTLSKGLGVVPDSLRRTLEGLAERGLVERNPGYGHPMRPEWILTPAGERVAPACEALLRSVRRLGMEEVADRKWAFPVLLALRPGEARFSEIERALPTVTPRALAQTLRGMESAGAVLREVADSRPPAVTYRLEPRARRLLPAVERLFPS